MPGHAGPLLAFTLGAAELVILGLVVLLALIPIFIFRTGKNAGRAEAMREQLNRDRGEPKA